MGLRRNNTAGAAIFWLSVTSPATHKQIGPFWGWFQGGWVCVHSRTPWVSPMISPVRLGVSPAATTPTYFYCQRFWGFISPHWNPGLCGLSRSPVIPPGYVHTNAGSPSHRLTCLVFQWLPCPASSPPRLPVSTAPTGLDECFFFNSLIVRFPYSLIFWQFWLFFIFKFVVFLLLVVWGGKVFLPTPPSWPEVPYFCFKFYFAPFCDFFLFLILTISLPSIFSKSSFFLWSAHILFPFL